MFFDLKRFTRDVDVIHAHGSSTLIPFMAALTAGRTPLVISPHFHVQASSKLLGILKLPFERTVDRYALGKASKVICVSQTEADAIRARFSVSNKITVINNGVNVDEIQGAQPYEFYGSLILYVGRLERYKNLQRVVEALHYLPQDFALYVIGEGSFKRELEAIIEQNNLGGRVRLLGTCPDAQLYRWIQTSAVLVNLSEIEAFGITVIEALAAGKPVVVNDIYGLHEFAERFYGSVIALEAGKMSASELAKTLQDAVRVHSAVDLDEYRWDRIAFRTLASYYDAASH
jgi:glycosyltransferase involved in cell wall biosynthesis